MIKPQLLIAHAHNAKHISFSFPEPSILLVFRPLVKGNEDSGDENEHVLSFETLRNYGDPSDPITDHFTCTSANVIYWWLVLFAKLYIDDAGRRLGDPFREHLRDVEKDAKNASKPVARHFNLPIHCKQHMAVYGLSLHQGNKESRKTLEQKLSFQIGTLNPHDINESFSFNLFIVVYHVTRHQPIA